MEHWRGLLMMIGASDKMPVGTDFSTDANIEGPTRLSSGHPGRLPVKASADSINIHPANLLTLERIASTNPRTAQSIIDATNRVVELHAEKYRIGAFAAALISCVLLVCSAAVSISLGFWAGIVFFLCCAAVAAIV